ncbi:hypothetical protein DSO57_1000826 [Entomophthora muscae]|uniref:Uncharacterized protein n=1 Tax=Entomophthora muscae TaxID=34485 RepID=A0ACC2U8G6_9FUNG|nr:hypothetical protein DSO57_1000826 [Entomophthora muscae]
MPLGHCRSSLYCYENATDLFCPPIKLSQCSGSQRLSLTSDGSAEIHAPIAEQVPYNHTYHGQKYLDEYHWLRDDKRKNTEVLDHIKAENEYSKSLLASLKSLEDSIYDELISQNPKGRSRAKFVKGEYEYYMRQKKEAHHPIYCRKRVSEGSLAKEEVLLDLNQLEKEYLNLRNNQVNFYLGASIVSPDQKFLVYTLDITGDETYAIFVKDLKKGTTYEVLKETTGLVVWSNDGQHLYYTTNDDKYRSYRLYRHKLGNQQSSDELLYEEKDEEFSIRFKRSISET